MQSPNPEDNDFDGVWRPATAPGSEHLGSTRSGARQPADTRSAMRHRIGKRMLRGGAMLGLAVLLVTGPLACQCVEPEENRRPTREEPPKYDWH